MCAGSAAGVIVGGEGAANGAGAIAGAGFVAAEPAFEAVVSTLPLRSVVAYEARLTSKGRGALKHEGLARWSDPARRCSIRRPTRPRLSDTTRSHPRTWR